MKTQVWIDSLTFSDDSTINFEKNDIVVLVGANNSGKSATLREAEQRLNNEKEVKSKVLKGLTFKISGDKADFIEDLENSSLKKLEGLNVTYSGFRYNLNASNIDYFFKNIGIGLQGMQPYFVNRLSTENRIQASNPPQNIHLTQQASEHPIHNLQKDDTLELRFSDYFYKAFGTDLIVHRNAGNQVPLYVGQRPVPQIGEQMHSINYIKEIEKLDLLHEQGDGMRSFVGVLLNAFVSSYSILFIDEPEAYLHPPQSRFLGKMLSKDLPSDRQMFIATHSQDFLQGLLESDDNKLRIIRIQRDGNINKVHELTNLELKKIWSDSILRHSNILNGLFHSKVILCESDSDCRFFTAILSNICEEKNTPVPDFLFIHCGGKHRMPTVIKALNKLNVPIKVISDFDLLNNIYPIKEIFEDLGGSWDEIEKDWNIVKQAIESKKPDLLTDEVKKEVKDIFNESNERIFPKSDIIKIQQVLKKASVWNIAKGIGKPFIPSGQATQAFERLQLIVKSKGLLILEVGELEGFVKSVGNHGPKWVNEVLSKDISSDVEFDVAKKFLEQIWD
ncbi:MAG: AAA family ATPase [Cytophagales bacterium]|nr:AAA family ATPase [Cytophagales bacterium]